MTEEENMNKEPNVFEEKITQEVLKSEELRTTILAGVFVVSMVFAFSITAIFPEIFPEIGLSEFHGISFRAWLGIILGISCVYELAARWRIRRFTEESGKIITIFRYGNALVETSIPTIILIFSAQMDIAAYILLSPGVFLYFIFIALSALRLDYKLCVFTGFIAASEYLLLFFYYVLPVVPPQGEEFIFSPGLYIIKGILLLTVGLVIASVTLEIKRRMLNSFQSIEDKNEIIGMFGQYVSPDVVEQLIGQETGMQSETRPVCVMFLDIRNFSDLFGKKRPVEIVSYLNLLYDFMIEIVNRNHGIINKFLGDGFMAVFGAPFSDGDHCRHATTAALEIITRIRQEIESGRIPPTRVGIGIHVGEAVTGNVGSSDRKEYTVIGDVVNLASRIEQLNKKFDSEVLISEEVWDDIGKDIEGTVALGPVQVKGHQDPVQIYQLG